MKKSCLMLFVAPALLLVSCGDSGKVDSLGVTEPTGGTSTTLDKAAPKLATAVGGTVKAGAFSASLSIPSAVSTITTPDVTIEETLKNGTAALAVQGYAGTKASDFKVAASLGFDSLKVKTTAAASANSSNDSPFANANIEMGKVSLGAYVSDSTFYLDISNSNFRSALIAALASGDSSLASAYSSLLPPKLFVPGIITDSNMPLVNVTSFAASLDQIATKIAEKAETFNSFFTMKDYSNGKTTIYGKFDKDSIAEFAAKMDGIEPSKGYDYSSDLSAIKSEIGNNKLNFSFAVTFDSDHLLSVGIGEDIDFTQTNHDDYEGDLTTHIVSSASMELTLAYGDDVKVNLPSDLSDYVAFNFGA